MKKYIFKMEASIFANSAEEAKTIHENLVEQLMSVETTHKFEFSAADDPYKIEEDT